MKPKTLDKLQYFIGKVCSIVTSSMNRAFDEKLSREHFVVRIQEINIDGLWGSHPYNNDLISFFSLQHIISIHEEVELDPSNPEHRAMIKEYEEKTGTKIKPDIGKLPAELLPIIESPAEQIAGDSAFIDIANLEQLAENTKRSLDAYDAYLNSKH